MDLTPQVTNYAVDDNSWLVDKHGTETGEVITLDLSTFDASQHANGFIPSGCVLGKITASGLYGPYDDTAADGRQTLDLILYGGVKVNAGSTKVGAVGLWTAHVDDTRLPFQAGQTGRGYVDANGKTDVAGRIRFFHK